MVLGFNSMFTNPFQVNRPLYSMEGRVATDAVKTQNGLVSGFYNKDKTVREFTGIPYAAPPVGELRWKSPQPAKSWDGVRQLDHFSDAAMQSKSLPIFSKYLGLALGTDELLKNSSIKYNEKVSEDCLYLNVWSSAKSSNERLPVIVYIHGGSFVYGSGSMDVYNGENMAKKGVVFVNINYRLGIFGFMAHPELTKESEYNSSGNYGILDQIAALQWVKNNISEFGGDPDNVTIAGESAGAGSVNILMASPLAKGLFHRAIAESGAFFSSESRESGGNPERKLSEAEKDGVEIQKSLEKTSISDMREMSAKDLLKLSKNQTIVPNIDGYVLPDTVYKIFKEGNQNDVPILVGSNSDEGSLLTLPWPATATVSADKFKDIVAKRYGSLADELLKLYPADSNNKAVESQVKISTDHLFTWQMNTWAKLQSKTGKSKAYYYYFDKVQPGPSRFKELGAYHSAEISYAYNNLDKIDLPYTEIDKKLSDIMSSYWINFATTGNPNGQSLPTWREYNEESDQAMRLGDKVEMIKTPNKSALELFDIHEENLRLKNIK
ncbi:carboxylesterase family protein [Clostridium sp. AL.422]|uniref:carboxylesterase/lipase family protein n=1 Tax=Clostridium TaxID=1485 RepID=UPI00293DFE33|nr:MULTISPECIES: carboxylesterase family protein [unclassified Clostridium]MDV4150854.1 carboxylesterase family protein [Clostridium sp. AL.422]